MGVSRALVRRAHRVSIDGIAAFAERGDAPARLPHPPILVVGPPRSGTTLLNQVLVAGLDIGWFSGWHNAVAGGPGLVPPRLLGAPATHFSSDHGRLSSWREPHESATWWYRFFPRERHALQLEDVERETLDRLRRSTSTVLARAGRPVVWKNVVNSVRLAPIIAALPEAIIVVIHRDVAATARSIERARVAENGTDDQWWSVEPADIEALRALPVDEQIRGQITGVRDALAAARETHPDVSWVDVDYEQLVTEPRLVVGAVGSEIERRTGQTQPPPTLVPDAFRRPTQTSRS